MVRVFQFGPLSYYQTMMILISNFRPHFHLRQFISAIDKLLRSTSHKLQQFYFTFHHLLSYNNHCETSIKEEIRYKSVCNVNNVPLLIDGIYICIDSQIENNGMQGSLHERILNQVEIYEYETTRMLCR